MVLLFNVVCIHKRYLKCVAPLAAPAAGTGGETPRLCEKPAHGRAVGGYSFHGASPGRTCFFAKGLGGALGLIPAARGALHLVDALVDALLGDELLVGAQLAHPAVVQH